METDIFPTELDALQSRGSLAAKPGSLGALHAKRKQTLSQYFTPAWLSRYMWQVIAPAFPKDLRYSVLDNSIGSASLFRYADPNKIHMYGFDIDGDLVADVARILEASPYRFDILQASLETVELERFSAAVINPPFSITLTSPFLTAYPGITHYGKHGPDTSALSHEYALAQALSHCDIVAAIVPQTTKDLIAGTECFANRLRAVLSLPTDTFRDENVRSVRCDLLIFGHPLNGDRNNQSDAGAVIHSAITPESMPPVLPGLHCRTIKELGHSRHPIECRGIEASKPVITLPATDNKTVKLKRAGRFIKLEFFDGATEAKVNNTLFKERLFSDHTHKYPAKTRYAGQFKLSLDIISMQDRPKDAIYSLCALISGAGGIPVVSPQLFAGLDAILAENRKMGVPFGRSVYRKGTPEFTAVAKRMALLNRAEKGAAVAMAEAVCAKRIEAGFLVRTGRGEFSCEHDLFFSVFEPESAALDEGYWEDIHPPIAQNFPKEIERLRKKALAFGIDRWLTWDYQLEDLLELAFKPNGGICGWQMALGKSRLALALSLLLEGRSLLVLKSRLVPEMVRELETIGFTDFKVIKRKGDIAQLGKINIISYERLKRPISLSCPKLTFAKYLRKKIANVLCDEGGLLANIQSQQTQAVWQLGAKRKYILDGTPCPNYPREMLNLAAWTVGEERAYQPFSMNGGFIEPRLLTSAQFQTKGRDEFNNRFVTIEWATNEFLDTGVGAKREVPKIKPANLQNYRDWLAPMLKRRVQQEPAVGRYVKFPVPELLDPIEVEWEYNHLLLYIQVAEEFAGWFRKYAKDSGDNGKALNLTIILARLEACFKAANVPSSVFGYGRGFQHLTTKEIACLDLIESEVMQGARPIVFARNPAVLHRLSAGLAKRSISNLVFTGEETIEKRIKKLNSRIRDGHDQVLLASMGVTQDGLNLPELDTVIFYNRSYKNREEFQGIYRLIRPKQRKKRIKVQFLHLKGSIDDYQGQLIRWKTLASEAGLDYGEQSDSEEFVHFDAFIYRFINSIPALKETLDSLRKRSA